MKPIQGVEEKAYVKGKQWSKSQVTWRLEQHVNEIGVYPDSCGKLLKWFKQRWLTEFEKWEKGLILYAT